MCVCGEDREVMLSRRVTYFLCLERRNGERTEDYDHLFSFAAFESNGNSGAANGGLKEAQRIKARPETKGQSYERHYWQVRKPQTNQGISLKCCF